MSRFVPHHKRMSRWNRKAATKRGERMSRFVPHQADEPLYLYTERGGEPDMYIFWERRPTLVNLQP